MTKEPGSARVLSAMSVAVVALSFSSIFITKLEHADVPPLVIAFYRMAIATLLLLPAGVALRREEMLTLARKEIGLILLGGLCLAVHFGAWIASLKYIPISTAVVLVNTHPVFIALASYLFLKEKPTARSAAGTAVGLAGMAIIGRDGFRDIEVGLVGNALAVTGALAVVGYFVVGRLMRSRVSLLGYVIPLYSACSLILLGWALVSGNRLFPYPDSAWAYFAALAVVPTIFGHTVFNWAIKHVRASAISIAFLGEPVVASLLAYLFFAQHPPTATYAGGAMVLAGIYLTTSARPGARPGPESNDPARRDGNRPADVV